MNLEQLIEPTIPILRSADTVADALRMMSETHYAKLPLVEDGVYLNLLREADLLDIDDEDTTLVDCQIPVFRPSCYIKAHPFDAIKAAIQFNLPVVPLLGDRQEYIGSVSRASLLGFMGENGGLTEPGGIIILEVQPRDYVLSQIAKIAENEEFKILNVRVYHNPQTEMLEVTLKVNKTAVQSFVAALERYEYLIKAVYGDMPAQDYLDDRYRLLINYLNI